jgi:hypothetical protein
MHDRLLCLSKKLHDTGFIFSFQETECKISLHVCDIIANENADALDHN